MLSGDHRQQKLYSRAKLCIAKQTNLPIGTDTATALLESGLAHIWPVKFSLWG